MHAWQRRNTAETLTLRILSQSSSCMLSTGPPPTIPALLTRKSIRPQCAIAASAIRVAASSAATSIDRNRRFECSMTGSAARSTTNTEAPPSSKRLAVARPIPLFPPVTMATKSACGACSVGDVNA